MSSTKSIGRGLLFLLTLGGVCAYLLHSVNTLTAKDIQQNREAAALQIISDLTGPAIANSVDLSRTDNHKCPTWLLLQETVPGYAGPIEFMFFVEPDADAISARTINHRETPGIGDFIDSTRDQYLQNLDRSSYAVWASLDNVSGASITSAALRRALESVLERSRRICGPDQDG